MKPHTVNVLPSRLASCFGEPLALDRNLGIRRKQSDSLSGAPSEALAGDFAIDGPKDLRFDPAGNHEVPTLDPCR
jgi:hypothetical protein